MSLTTLYFLSQEETGDPNMAPDGYYVPRILFVGKVKSCFLNSPHWQDGIMVTVDWRLSFVCVCVTCFCTDPSLTVRADIKGQYSNHHYTYEPKDMELCEWICHHIYCTSSVVLQYCRPTAPLKGNPQATDYIIADFTTVLLTQTSRKFWVRHHPAPNFTCS